MKRFLGMIIALSAVVFSYAQVTEINPNIDWKYVKSQDLDLKKGSSYQYEFAAEKGYDYVFSMSFSEVDLITSLRVLDLQKKPIAEKVDSSSSATSSMTFRVPDNATYVVVLGYDSKNEGQDEELTTQFTLIRRPRVN